MAIRCENSGHRDRRAYELPITRASLGDATGLTGVHVNRTLKELRENEVMEFRAGKVTINEWDRLVRIGDCDPRYALRLLDQQVGAKGVIVTRWKPAGPVPTVNHPHPSTSTAEAERQRRTTEGSW
jgi:hypothetical protein